MIIVKNREMIIPNHERHLGTTYDTESEMRLFQIPRYSQRGVDLSALTFRLDLKYANNVYDTVILSKEVTDDYVLATWEITSSQLQVPGTLFAAIRATDDEVTVKWSTYNAAFYADRHLNTPGNYTGDLTEIEQMEQDHQYFKHVVNELETELSNLGNTIDNALLSSLQTGEFKEELAESVDGWLVAHPEATTTVQDNSLTNAKYKDQSISENKLDASLKDKVNNTTLLDTHGFGAINYILDIAKDYMDDDAIIYDSSISPWLINTPADVFAPERGLTCSDWAMLAFFGIRYEKTRWYKANTKNIPSIFSNEFKELFSFKSGAFGSGTASEQIAKFLDDKGLLYTPNDDLSNVLSGDIIFYNLDAANDNDPMPYPLTDERLTRYKGIDHCAVFVGHLNSEYYSVLEVQTDGGVVFYKLERNSRNAVLGLRNPMIADKKPNLIARYYNENGLTSLDTVFDLMHPIKAGDWITCVVDGEIGTECVWLVDAYNDSASPPAYERLMGISAISSNDDFYFDGKKSLMIVRATFDTERIRFQIGGRTAGATLSCSINRIELFNGFSYGTDNTDSVGIKNYDKIDLMTTQISQLSSNYNTLNGNVNALTTNYNNLIQNIGGFSALSDLVKAVGAKARSVGSFIFRANINGVGGVSGVATTYAGVTTGFFSLSSATFNYFSYSSDTNYQIMKLTGTQI